MDGNKMADTTLQTGQTVQGETADGAEATGTVARVMSRDTATCRVTLSDGTTVTLTGCVTADTVIVTRHTVDTADAGTLAVGDTLADGYTVDMIDPDGTVSLTGPHGRPVRMARPDGVTLAGCAVVDSYGAANVQGGRVARTYGADGAETTGQAMGPCTGWDGAGCAYGCDASVKLSDFATTAASATAPTGTRLRMCRTCNSDRLAAAKGAKRTRGAMPSTATAQRLR